MRDPATPVAQVEPAAPAPAAAPRGRLFRKYVAMFVAVVSLALVMNAGFEIWFSYQEQQAALIRVQREQAEAAAGKIGQFIKEIESQLGWTTQLPWSAGTVEQRRFDALRLLRQVPAVTELAQLDAAGKEQLKVSRLAMDVLGSGVDQSSELKFTETVAKKVYYGPVYFRRESEPYMTLGLAGTRRDAGVSIAEVNLKFIWDVVSQIKVGEKGQAFVVDQRGRLIAHPDISLVLRNTDMSTLPQVKAALGETDSSDAVREAKNLQGKHVLTAASIVPALGWRVFVELPRDEAYAPLYAAVGRSTALLGAGLLLALLAALVLARRMAGPIQRLRAGAARIGHGDLSERISIKTGDELETLADQFNDMAGRLQESYTDLEKKVEVRTHELSESLQQQTATAEVLKVISRSTFELQPVLDTLVESAAELCDADQGAIFLLRGDRVHFAAHHGYPPEWVERVSAEPLPLDASTISGVTIKAAKTINIADVLAEEDSGQRFIRLQRYSQTRSLLGVPLMRGSVAIGSFSLARKVVKPFTEKQIELVTTFADQAVIAIENTRLFDEVQARTVELTESLEQQTATSEVLQVISSSPGELAPVFEAMLANATRICGAKFGALNLYDGETFRLVAHHNLPPAFVEVRRDAVISPHPQSGLAKVARTKQVVQIEDLRAGVPYLEGHSVTTEMADLGGARTIVVVPMLKEGELIGCFSIYRQEVRPFNDKQIALLTSFANQAVIAIENARLLKELRERTDDLTESLEQQTATSEVLQAISGSPGELDPVFEAMLANATQICSARFGMLKLYDGEVFQNVKFYNVPAAFIDARRDIVIRPHPESGLAQLVRTKRVVQIEDLRTLAARFKHEPAISAAADLGGARTLVHVPMLKEGELIGSFTIYRQEVRPFSDKQIALLTSFANQAVIAIENARLLKELRERTDDLSESLQQQTATADVLRVMSTSPTDVQPVFEAIVRSALTLCDGLFANMFRFDGEQLHFVASHNAWPSYIDRLNEKYPMRPDRSQVSGRVMLTKSVVRVEDVLADPEYDQQFPATMQWRRMLGVPMMREGVPLGVIVVGWAEPGHISKAQEEMLKTFADQGVIAIENVRLFDEVQARTKELTESLRQQTATADVLKVISRSAFDLQPVLDVLVETAAGLCEADHAYVFRRHGDVYQLAASHGFSPDYESYLASQQIAVSRNTLVGRTALTAAIVHIPDAVTDPEYTWHESQQRGGFRTMLGVPLLRDGVPIGVVALTRSTVSPFSQKQIDLVTTFADQAVIAIENVRLFDEVQARTGELARSVEELKALGEVTQAVNSSLDLETVLDTIVAKAVQLSGTDAGAIYVFSSLRQKFRLRATYGMNEKMIEAIGQQTIRLGDGPIGEAAVLRKPVQTADLREGALSAAMSVVYGAGYRALLAIPLMRLDKTIGALVVRRRAPGAFADATVSLLETFAAQSALAIQNARLFADIEEKGRQLELASQHKSQFLANMSHELRTPMNAVLGFAEMLADGLYGDLPQKAKGALERVQANGKHLLGLINDVLDLSKIEAGQLELALDDYAVGQVVQTVVAGTQALARNKGLKLTANVQDGLPIGYGDDRRLTQVLLNLVGNAIKFTDKGEVAIEAKAAPGGLFELSVRDTGPGIAAEHLERIFEEFQQVDDSNTRQKGGTGLGLAISKSIVELHGGAIRVASKLGVGSTFFVTLPVRTNDSREAAE